MAEVNTKQWWISELNVILAGSNFEAIGISMTYEELKKFYL